MQTEALDIKIPSSTKEWEDIRADFQSKSTNGFIHGCVGAIDGYLQEIIAPTMRDTLGNVDAFFSGHYLVYGINCIAVCDAQLRFLYFGVVSPGKTNDNVSFRRTEGLIEAINRLPQGLFLVGDAAFTLSENLLIPFVGCLAGEVEKDAYNFHISQLRIRIEMAFGRLVKKFAILGTKMRTGIKNTTKILMSCARLHNYLINKRAELMDEDGNEDCDNNEADALMVRMGPCGMQYLPSLPESFEEIEGYSQIRQSILDSIQKKKIRRPNYNIERNRQRAIVNSFRDIPREYFHPR